MRFVTHAEDPGLIEGLGDLTAEVWPEYNRHGDVMNRYWGRLYDVFPQYQFVLVDDDGTALAEGHTAPLAWDGTIEGLPAGIDGAVEDAFALAESGRPPDTLCALAIEIPPANQSRRLSPAMLGAMRSIAERDGLTNLIAPLRPNWKERYPITPIEDYASWVRADGLPFDPWIRTHVRLGARILAPVEESLVITGSVAEWEQWTGMAFPASGRYVFPHGLAPVAIDRDADRGLYWEPNVWMHHPIIEPDPGRPAAASERDQETRNGPGLLPDRGRSVTTCEL